MTQPKASLSWLVIGFGACLIGLLAAASWWSYQAASAPLVATCGCGSWLFLSASGHYWPAVSLLTATGVALGTISLLLWRANRREQELQSSFTTRGFSWYQRTVTTENIAVVNDQAAYAVTVGFFQPRIFLSRGLLKLLTKSEIQAVIKHEVAHARGRHPLLRALTAAVAKTFFFLPWLQTWTEVARAQQEIIADASASNGYRSVQPLASALVKLSASPVMAGVAWTPLEARVDQLLNPKAKLFIPHRGRSFMAAVALLSSVAVVGLLAVRSARATSPMAKRCVETRLMCAEQARQSAAPQWPTMSFYGVR